MALPILLLLFGIAFAVAGFRHWWKSSLLVLASVGTYAIWLWNLPVDPTEDWQMVQLWRTLVAGFIVACSLGFIVGIAAARTTAVRQKFEGRK